MNITRRQALIYTASTLAMSAMSVPAVASNTNDFDTAKVDWKQFNGQNINVLLSRHPWQEAIEPLIPDFESLTGIKVNLRILPEQQFLTKVPADLTAGTFQFDVFMTQISQAPMFASRKWLTPIDVYLNDAKLTDPDWYDWDKDIFPSAQEAATIGNTPFSNLPITTESQVLIYRTDILKDNGIEIPKTFDEVIEAAKTINEKTNIKGITVRGGAALWWPLFGVIKSYGGNFFDTNFNPALADPNTIAGVKAYVELARLAPQGVTNYDWDEINTAMLSGQAAMFIDSSVVYPRLKDQDLSTISDKIGIAPFPSGPSGSRANSHYWTISMAHNAGNKEAAWLFMQWATSRPIQKALALKGVLAPRNSAWQGDEISNALGQEFIDGVRTSLLTASLYPVHENFLELVDALRQNVQDAMTGSKSVDQAMLDAQNTWVSIVK